MSRASIRRRWVPWSLVLGLLVGFGSACSGNSLEGEACAAESINRYRCDDERVSNDCESDQFPSSGPHCEDGIRWTLYRCLDGADGPTLQRIAECPMGTTCTTALDGLTYECVP